jgi:predicted DCC family thiol-disulfide oxidoreductase YuxK
MAVSRQRPVLVYDGDCGFCTKSARLAARLPSRCEIVAWQHADLAALGATQERAAYELLWVTPDGRIYGGADAVAMLLRDSGGMFAVLGGVLGWPGLRSVAHRLYRLIADNRYRLPGGTPACALPAEQRPGAHPTG